MRHLGGVVAYALLLVLFPHIQAQGVESLASQVARAEKNTVIELSGDVIAGDELTNAHGAEITLRGIGAEPVRLYGLRLGSGTFYIDNAQLYPPVQADEDGVALAIDGEADVTLRQDASAQGDVSLRSQGEAWLRCYGDIAGMLSATAQAGAQLQVINPGKIGGLSLRVSNAFLTCANTGVVESGAYLSVSGEDGGITLMNAQDASLRGGVICRATAYRGAYAAVTVENEGQILGGVKAAGTVVLVDYGAVVGGIHTRLGERAEGFVYVYLPRVQPDTPRARARACHTAYKRYQADPRDICFRFE